jgi:formate hydrogenlyase transcriptional activator
MVKAQKKNIKTAEQSQGSKTFDAALNRNEILLDFTRKVAQIRVKDDLMKLIREYFQTIFYFTHCTVTIIADDKKTFQVYFVDPGSKLRGHKDYQELVTRQHSINDGIYNAILQSDDPVIIDVTKNTIPGTVPFYINILQESGINELIGIPLSCEKKQIGVLSFFSDKKKSFIKETFPLIKSIVEHISLAVNNALAIEIIEKKVYEREILLALSSEIAKVRDKNDLLSLVQNKLKNFFIFNDIVIVLLNDSQSTFTILLSVVDEGRGKHPEFEEIVTIEYPVKDGIHDEALKANGAVVLDIDNLMKNPDKHRGIQFIYDTGIKGIAAIKLVHKNKPIGILTLLTEVKDAFKGTDLNLLEGISHQLSVSVANILANEEIKNREDEKSILLSLSNEIAAVRNRDDFLYVVNTKLKELFSVQGFGIGLISEDGKTHSPFLIAVDNTIESNSDFKEVISQKYSVTDGVFDILMNSDEPVTFMVSDFQEGTGYPAYVNFWKELNIQTILGVRLQVSSVNLGCLFFHLDTILLNRLNKNLLKGVCSQISIALSNILANEKIARQLEQISRYKEQLEEEKLYLQEEVSSGYTFSDIIGNGLEMQKVFHQLSQVAFANSTVLLLGETGTGKELIAKAIHNSSARKNKLMVKVNCAALPVNLIESELFGHEKGSFTGAIERRIGKFELANHGTLFLDEIGEMPLDLQVKLLRAIQEKEIERIGGKATIKTDVRIIAATNRNLQKEADEGRFRRDLYYRLNVFPITLPPLRERKDDIPVLAAHFIGKYAKSNGKTITDISGKVIKELQAYAWPGNVRELEHLIERSILTTTGKTIKEIHLPINKREALKNIAAIDYLKTHEENERDYIIAVLNNCKGKIFGTGGAAEILNLNVSTLNSKIKKLGIKKERSFYTKSDASS